VAITIEHPEWLAKFCSQTLNTNCPNSDNKISLGALTSVEMPKPTKTTVSDGAMKEHRNQFCFDSELGRVRAKYAETLIETMMLQREALWLSRLNSQGLSTQRCLDFYRDGTRAALLTNYVEGQSLSDLLQRDKLNDIDAISSIIDQLLSELEELHRCGFVHGDIKPSNILLSEQNILSFIDFSNARRVGDNWQERGVEQYSPSYVYPNNASSQRRQREAHPVCDSYASLITIALLIGVPVNTLPIGSDSSQAIDFFLSLSQHETWALLPKLTQESVQRHIDGVIKDLI
jgi:serine/threonine protein kinase